MRAKTIAASPTAAQHTAVVYDQTVSGLRGLGAPSGDRGKTDQLNTLLARLAGINHQISAAASQNTGHVAQLSTAANRAAERYASAARAYGLGACTAAAKLGVPPAKR